MDNYNLGNVQHVKALKSQRLLKKRRGEDDNSVVIAPSKKLCMGQANTEDDHKIIPM